MALTRDFRETVQARVARDASYRRALLAEAVNELLAGELRVGKSILRDYVNATIGFEGLAAEIGKSSKLIQKLLFFRGLGFNKFFPFVTILDRREIPTSIETSEEPGHFPEQFFLRSIIRH